MKSLLIIGAGGYGKVVREIAMLNGFERIDFLDDNVEHAVGTLEQIDEIQPQYDYAIVAIGNAELREQYHRKIDNPITLIHPSAIISPSSIIGLGCVIEAGTVINTETTIGESSFICAGAVVNHEAMVGNYCQIDCNAVVGAGVLVKDKMKVATCTALKNLERPIEYRNESFF